MKRLSLGEDYEDSVYLTTESGISVGFKRFKVMFIFTVGEAIRSTCPLGNEG